MWPLRRNLVWFGLISVLFFFYQINLNDIIFTLCIRKSTMILRRIEQKNLGNFGYYSTARLLIVLTMQCHYNNTYNHIKQYKETHQIEDLFIVDYVTLLPLMANGPPMYAHSARGPHKYNGQCVKFWRLKILLYRPCNHHMTFPHVSASLTRHPESLPSRLTILLLLQIKHA